jgi:hypothetical protein
VAITAQLHPAADRTMLARGAVAVLLSYERALPLIGLGCVLALMRPSHAALGAGFALLGLYLGFAARGWLIAALVSGPATAGRLALPGPAACFAAGIVLAVPDRLRAWLLPAAALVIGATLAVAIKLVDPSFHDPNFLRGAIAASLWLVAAIALTGRLCDRPWFRIAIRIVGSWLIAIGLMLGAAILLPRPTIAIAPQQVPQSLEAPGPKTPGPPDPALPDAGPLDPARPPRDAGRKQVPSAPPGFDPLRQP